MKTTIALLVAAVLSFNAAVAQQTNSLSFSDRARTAGYSISETGAHHRVWTRIRWATNNTTGTPCLQTNSFRELSSGLNRWNGTRWVESRPTLTITNDTIIGVGAPHSVVFENNINSPTAVRVQYGSGQWLRGGPLCLAYHDVSNGSNAYFAIVKDSAPLLVASNRVVYPDAFDGVTASVSYSYTKAGVSQDVRFQSRPPSPRSYGLNPSTTHLVVITEFTNTAQPQIEEHTWRAGLETIHDKTLHFGSMAMFPGRAFKASSSRKFGVRVAKDWIAAPDGRKLLIESIQYSSAKATLSTLQAPVTNVISGATNAAVTRPTRWMAKDTWPARLNPTNPRRKSPEYVATLADPEGFVMDWDVESDDGYWSFDCGTWVVNGPCRISSADFYEGAVLKYLPGYGSSLEITGTANFQGAGSCVDAGYPVCTSAYDDDIGENLGFNQSPQDGDYGPAIVLDDCSQAENLSNFEIRYATDGIICSPPATPTVSVTAGQPLATKGADPAENGSFTISREDGDWTQPLAVYFSLTNSTAAVPTDYSDIGTSVVIGEGQGSTNITIAPGSAGGSVFEKYVELTIVTNSTYNTSDSSSATVYIYDPLASSPSSVPTSAPSGLVALWKAEDNATDVKAGISGTFYSSNYESGVVGKAFVFDGDGGHVRIADQTAFHFTNACTIEAWVNLGSLGDWHEIVSKWDAAGGVSGKSYTLGTYPDGRVKFGGSHDGDDGTSTSVVSTNSLCPGKWTHVAATYDGTNLKMYIDGSLQSTVNWPGSFYAGTHDLSIGACVGNVSAGSGVSFFNGRIDEVSLYNTALSASQISDIYTAGRGGKCLAPVIITQPTNQYVFLSSNATFTVVAHGLPTLAYQWRQGGTNLSGATASALTISNVQSNNLGNYSVVVTNAFGSVTSSIASLNFDYPFIVITNPVNAATFSARANIFIQAVATNNAHSITNVQFYSGVIPIGPSYQPSTNLYQLDWTNIAAGIYTLTAVARESHGLVATSTVPVTVTVGADCTYTYASNNAFGMSAPRFSLHNLTFSNTYGRLELTTQAVPFPFLNLPCGPQGTVQRISTTNGSVVGEYRTAPATKPSFPGHAVVDRYGNIWVANWDEAGNHDTTHMGSVTKIGVVIGGVRGNKLSDGTFETNANGLYVKDWTYSTAIDRDGDGLIHTSLGTNVLNWPSNSPAGSVSNAEDECIISYVRVPAQLVSLLAIDVNNDLWVGGYCDSASSDFDAHNVCSNKMLVKIHGVSDGVVEIVTNSETVITNGTGIKYGGFEGLVTANGMLWSTGGGNPCDSCSGDGGNNCLVFYNPALGTNRILMGGSTNIPSHPFSLAIDPKTQNVWVSSFDGTNVSVFDSTGNWITNYNHGNKYAGGLAIDINSNVWVAHGPWDGGTTIGHLRTDGEFLENIDLSTNCSGASPASTVSIDSSNNIWAVCASRNDSSPKLVRIVPTSGAWATNAHGITFKQSVVDWCTDFPGHPNREAYGDLTGQMALVGTAPSGFWTVTYTNGSYNQPWRSVTWNASTIDSTQVQVQVRAFNGSSPNGNYQLIVAGQSLTNVVGTNLQIQVTLVKIGTNSPWLQDLTIDCSAPVPPSSTLSPTNVAVCPGTSTNLIATASGASPLSYLWRKDGAAISGQNTSALALNTLQATNAGLYQIEVTNAFGKVTNFCAVTVWTNLFVAGPSSQTNCPGTTATLSTTNSGTGPFSFVWRKNGNQITGETNSSLVITNLSATNAGTYIVEVTGLCKKQTNSATLTVLTNITASALSSIVTNVGASVSFVTSVTGSGPYIYQWSKNGTDLPGRTNSSYSIASVTLADSGTNSVRVSGPCNTVTQSATLTVIVPMTEQILSPTNNQFFVFSPTNIMITVTGYTSSGVLSNLTLRANGSVIGAIPNNQLSTNIYQLLWTNVQSGPYTLTANATNSLGATASSTVTNLIVNAMPTVAIITPAINFTSYMEVTNVLLQATNYDSDGTITNVVFRCDGTNLLGTYTNNNPIWSFSWTNRHAGNFAITAVATDTNGASTTSKIRVFTVSPSNSAPGVAITSPTNLSSFPAYSTFTLIAETNGVGTATNVDFYVNGVRAGSVAAPPYSLTRPDCQPGTYTIIAKVTDSRGVTSASQTAMVYVRTPDPVPGQGFWDTAFANPGVKGLWSYPANGQALLVQNNNLYAGGRITEFSNGAFDDISTNFFFDEVSYWSSSLILKWNPTNWSALVPTDTNELRYPYELTSPADDYGGYCIGTDNTNLFLVDSFEKLWKWDGSNWTDFGIHFDGKASSDGGIQVYAITWFEGSLYIGGDFFVHDTNNSAIYFLIKVTRSGTNWLAEAVGTNQLNGPVYSMSVWNGALYVGGDFTGAGISGNPDFTSLNFLARLNNDHWDSVGGGVSRSDGTHDDMVRALTPGPDRLYVGGYFDLAGTTVSAPGIASWDGANWSAIASGVSGGNPYLNNGNSFADYLGELPSYVMGWVKGGEPPDDYVIHPPLYLMHPGVNSIALRGNEIFVSGNFTSVLDAPDLAIPANYVAKATWSETLQRWFWSDLDFGVSSTDTNALGKISVPAIAVMDHPNGDGYDVFVAGYFNTAGSAQIPSVGFGRYVVNGVPSASAPVAGILSPTNSNTFTNSGSPPSILIRGVAFSSTNITQMDFYADNALIGSQTDTNSDGSFHFTWTSASVGPHWLKVAATDSNGLRGQSGTTLINVRNASSTIVARDDAFALMMGTPSASLNVLGNDSTSTGNKLKVLQVVVASGSSGMAQTAFDGGSVTFAPAPATHGTNYLIYTVTDGASTNSAWITVKMLSMPTVLASASPVKAGTNTSILITGLASDFDGQVTNVTLFLGTNLITQSTYATNRANFSFSWSNNAVGWYTFNEKATDNDGLTNLGIPVTVTITNSTTGTNLLIASIDNLSNNLTSTLDGFSATNIPTVREGLFDLLGKARDPQTNEPVSYRLVLIRPDDEVPAIDPLATLKSSPVFKVVTPGSTDVAGFYHGTDTANDLGILDLTAVPNGTYDLLLTVHGGGGETNAWVRFQLESNLKIGQFSFSEQDLVLPVNGIPLTVTRTYNSLNSQPSTLNHQLDFGPGWTMALNTMDIQLDDQRQNVTIGGAEAPFADEEEDASGLPKVVSIRTGGGWDVTLTLPDGRRTTFAFDPWFNSDDMTYHARWTAPPGVLYTLTPTDSDEIDIYPSPPYWKTGGYPSTLENHDIAGWNLTAPDGTRYVINRGPGNNIVWDKNGDGSYINVLAYDPPKLTSIIQRTGDRLDINNNGIQHYDPSNHLTRSLFIARDPQNRITEIRDPISGSNGLPVVRYVYNRDTGNLIQVLKLTDRSVGTYVTNKYHYDHPNFPHYITSIDSPLGVPVARNEYDDSGRLTAVVDADGQRTEFHHDTSNRVEVVIDRLHRTNSHAYDVRGNVTASTNALGAFTLMSYDSNDYLLSTVDALNHTNYFAYDSKGNQTNVVNALNHTNSSSYDDLGNLVSTKDPLGNWTTNIYDSFGNLTDLLQYDANNNPLGHSSSIYDSGKIAVTLDASGHTNATFTYDGSGNLSASTDAKGFSRNFYYDANGNQISNACTINGSNIVTRTELDGQGRAIRTVDALGNTSQTFYNPLGKVDHSIDKLGNTTSLFYDSRGNLVQTIGADGLSTATVYNEDGKPIYTTDRNGISGTLTEYDGAGRVTNTVRLTNIVIAVTAISDGVWSSSVANAGGGYSTNSTEYFLNGWVKSRTGPDGKKTSYTYYDEGQTRTVTDALSHVTTYAYDDAGRQKYVADALNHTNQFVFDGLGRNIATIFADNSTITNIFNLLGQQIAKVDQASNVISYAFDISGQLTNVTLPSVPDPENINAPANPQWTYGYDAYNRLQTSTDSKLRSTTNTYNQFGQPVARLLPMGGAGETNYYNSLGQLTNHTDFKGQRALFAYDKFGRMKARFFYVDRTNAYPSNTICYLYDYLGRLTNITERFGVDVSTADCGGLAGLFGVPTFLTNSRPPSLFARAFAELRKLTPETLGTLSGFALITLAICVMAADVRRRSLILTAGNREHRGVRARFCFSSFSLLPSVKNIRVHSSSFAVRISIPAVFWRATTYVLIVCLIGSDPHFDSLWTAHAACGDVPSNTSTDTTRVTSFSYDFDGHLTQVNSPEGYINYEYEPATGRHIHTCTEKSKIKYDYDALGRLWKVQVLKRNGGSVTEPPTVYDYTEVGNRKSIALPNGVNTTYQYDSLNRLTNLLNTTTNNSLRSQFTYQLDATGRRTNAVEVLKTEDSGTPWQTNTLSWSYDRMYRLTNEICTSTAGGTYTNSYSYDKAGNRVKKIRYTSVIETNVSYFNANDQLTREEITPSSGTAQTNYYAYDANGSVTSRTNTPASGGSTIALYGYNLKNKLSSVATYNGSTWTTNSFQYNEQGIRVRASNGSYTTYYLTDANNLAGYAQILEERIGSTFTRSYVIGDDVLGQCGSDESTRRWLLYDGHGSTRQLADTTGSVASRYNYDAYGTTLGTSTTGAPATDLLYGGEQFDSVLGMYNHRARFYNPATGTFNQRDSFIGQNDDPRSLHKYAYCYQEPINQIDPGGLTTGRTEELLVSEAIYLPLAAAVIFAATYALLKLTKPNFRTPTYAPNASDNGQRRPPGWSAGLAALLLVGNLILQSTVDDRPSQQPNPTPAPDDDLLPPCGPGTDTMVSTNPDDCSYLRRKAVKDAWVQERDLLRSGVPGTRKWTADEVAELINTGRVYGYEGHHINSVGSNPQDCGDPDNIEFVTRAEHLARHNGNFRNPTWGEKLDRSVDSF